MYMFQGSRLPPPPRGVDFFPHPPLWDVSNASPHPPCGLSAKVSYCYAASPPPPPRPVGYGIWLILFFPTPSSLWIVNPPPVGCRRRHQQLTQERNIIQSSKQRHHVFIAFYTGFVACCYELSLRRSCWMQVAKVFHATTSPCASSRVASGHCAENLRKPGVSYGNLNHPEEDREVTHGGTEGCRES